MLVNGRLCSQTQRLEATSNPELILNQFHLYYTYYVNLLKQ